MHVYIQVLKSKASLLEDQRRLTTLEPRPDFPVLLLTLVTSSRRLALARRRTTTDSDSLLVRSCIVGQVGEDGCVPGLDGEGGKQAN